MPKFVVIDDQGFSWKTPPGNHHVTEASDMEDAVRKVTGWEGPIEFLRPNGTDEAAIVIANDDTGQTLYVNVVGPLA